MFDIEVFNDQILEKVRKQGKKVLITIDEVSSSAQMKEFCHSFQAMLRNEYPVFMLMTGLYQNVMDIQNDKTLTFLYRSEKINLESLNLSLIKDSYKEFFSVSDDEAASLAKLTCGYPFAYQVLGYLKWTNPEKDIEKLMPAYDQYLANYVYEKKWDESSGQDRVFLSALSRIPDEHKKASDVMKEAGMNDKTYSVYRDRLIRKGIVMPVKYGVMKFALPRFSVFVQRKTEFDF